MKTIKDFDLASKRVLIRCDFNVPIKEGKIVDDTRIVAALPTIQYALSKNAKIILLSHLGKVKEEKDRKEKTLAPVAKCLEKHLGQPVQFISKCIGEEVEERVKQLKEREIILLENTRFQDLEGKKESGNDSSLARSFANLGDIFINDAFATMHRSHASNVGITALLPSGIGLLVEKEVSTLSSLFEPKKPFIVILGGAKVKDKIGVIEKFALKCDKILIGGAMANTFLEAEGYEIGASLKEEESLSFCKQMLENYPDKLVLPVDLATSKVYKDVPPVIKDITELELDDMGLDIGPRSVRVFESYLKEAKTVLWNGPLGVYELPIYREATTAILSFLTEEKLDAKTVIGGGDTVACARENHLENANLYLSTGGGATLSFLENGTLVGLEAIGEKDESSKSRSKE